MRHRRPRALCAEEGSDASAYLPIVQPLATINAPSLTEPNPPHLQTLKRARVAARGFASVRAGAVRVRLTN